MTPLLRCGSHRISPPCITIKAKGLLCKLQLVNAAGVHCTVQYGLRPCLSQIILVAEEQYKKKRNPLLSSKIRSTAAAAREFSLGVNTFISCLLHMGPPF